MIPNEASLKRSTPAENEVNATEADMELVHGSGNVFRDHGRPNAGLEQARAILAAKIISVLDEKGMTARQAKTLTGIPESEFSRIRRVKLDRFTLDRLMTILNKLGQNVEISIDVHSRLSAASRQQPSL